MTIHADDLAGRPIVVSGAGSGIGAALAYRAAVEHRMTAVVADVDAARAEQVAAAITGAGGKAQAHAVDVSDPASVDALRARALDAYGAPALLVCNAGVEMTGAVWETEPRDWQRVQAINVNGAFLMARAFLPAMLQTEQPGHVLCTSSIGGISIGAGQSAYLVSKHAIRVFAQTLAADLEAADARIGVSILLPGAVRTRIFDDAVSTGSAGADEMRSALASHLANDGITPEQVAEIAFAGILEGRRWIHTHPEMSEQVLSAHLADLTSGVR